MDLARRLKYPGAKGGAILMINQSKYVPFALVALVASVLGWGASTYMNRETTNAMSAQNPAALGLQSNVPAANVQPIAPQAFQPVAPLVADPVAAQPTAPVERVVVVREAAPAVVRTAPVRARTASAPNESAANNASESIANNRSYEPAAPATARKKGMSNKAKTAIAIGGAAGVGAAIGGIAGGGKGAAIGAIAGAGAGAVYSVIRNKQNKPVF